MVGGWGDKKKRQSPSQWARVISLSIIRFSFAVGMSFEFARKGALFEVVDFSSLTVGAVFGAMGLGR